jgi:CNT family concentrative nucleoside transporter
MKYLQGTLGITFLLLICYFFSNNKSKIQWHLVIKALIFQIILALLVFHVEPVFVVFKYISKFFVQIYNFTSEGSTFVFGNLVDKDKTGWIFALQVLPSLIFFSALFSLLYYIRILPLLINSFSWLMKKTLRISGAESLAAAGNIFLGQSETPLLIKPLLPNLTRSEMNCLITGGFATISGAILGSASGMLGGDNPELQESFATHFLIASILSAPAAILVAKIMVPETENVVGKEFKLSKEHVQDKNPLDAISSGTFDGLKLALNVGAMLLVFVSLISMLNFILSDLIGEMTGLNAILPYAKDGFTLEYVFGWLFAPFAWLIGVPSHDMLTVGQLIGEKTAINEFYAYAHLKEMIGNGMLTDNRTLLITSYALCGFSNFSSIGIMIGGITALAPGKRTQVAELSIKALIGGTIACLLTAAVAGIFY